MKKNPSQFSVCPICGVSILAIEDLCEECMDVKEILEAALNVPARRRLIATLLRGDRFAVIDYTADEECPISCGYCCKVAWHHVLALSYCHGDGNKHCPHLKDSGCELKRDERPRGCVGFLRPLAWAVKQGNLDIDAAREAIRKHGGDAVPACVELLGERSLR